MPNNLGELKKLSFEEMRDKFTPEKMKAFIAMIMTTCNDPDLDILLVNKSEEKVHGGFSDDAKQLLLLSMVCLMQAYDIEAAEINNYGKGVH